MRILHITPSFQHPKVRGPNRHYHFLRELSQRHEMTLLALDREPVPPEARNEIASYAEQVLTFDVDTDLAAQGRVGQWRALRAAVAQMRRAFREIVQKERFDVVLFHGKSVFPVVDGWSELPIVVDFCDATSMRLRMKMHHDGGVKTPLLAARYLQVRRVERRLAAKTPYLAFISSRDREAVLGPADRSEIVPNGVDLGYWTRGDGLPSPNCVVFTGVMDYAPNEDAAFYLIDEILPRVRRSVPELDVLIVGRNPSPALEARASGEQDVTVTGFVEDMRPYLARAAVCAAPLRYASGMQNKVIEAMAMSVPVVTTPVVADGLRFDDGVEPPVAAAEGADQFARKLAQLLGDAGERERLAEESRRFIQENLDWSRSAAKLEAMCVAAVESAAHGTNGGGQAMNGGSGIETQRAVA